MTNHWQGKSVVIIGAARQGLALARYLSARGARVTLNDQRTPDQMKEAIQTMQVQPGSSNIQWALDGHPLDLLNQTDLVCISGGIPLSLPIIFEAQRRGLPMTNDSQIFLEAVKAPVIGITGSAGKTTTTTLAGRMATAYAAETGKRRAWLGGNIGLPLVEYIAEIQADDLVVLELCLLADRDRFQAADRREHRSQVSDVRGLPSLDARLARDVCGQRRPGNAPLSEYRYRGAEQRGAGPGTSAPG